jgi:hypothetical protein
MVHACVSGRVARGCTRRLVAPFGSAVSLVMPLAVFGCACAVVSACGVFQRSVSDLGPRLSLESSLGAHKEAWYTYE